MMVNLSVGIVSFNTKSRLRDCLSSIYKNTKGITFEVFVVDNASIDGSADMVAKEFSQVKLIRNRNNLFLTKAQNQAMFKARGKYFLILNSDTIAHPGTLKKAVDFLDKHQKVGALGIKHLYPNGELEQTCQRFTTPVTEFLDTNILVNLVSELWKKPKALDRIRYAKWDRTTSRYVEAVSDACMFVPLRLLKKIGYYDEKFLLFFTENDLSLRIRKLGYSSYHLADASITHVRAQSLAHFRPYKNYKLYEHDMLVYYRKYFGQAWWLFLYVTTRLNHIYYLLEPIINRLLRREKRDA